MLATALGTKIQPIGETTMKKLITVESNLEDFDIFLNMERLDGLPNNECDYLLKHLQRHIVTYQRLRHARKEIEAAEQEMTVAKSESAGPYFSDDLPF
jgi:hypothetical protein